MKKVFLSLTCLILVGLFCFNLTACGNKTVKAENLMDEITAQTVSGKPADDDFIYSQMNFAVELFKRSTKKTGKENSLVSPLSVMLALAMLTNGAEGETKVQLEKVLGRDISSLNEYLFSYVKGLPSEEKYMLEIANSIWLRDNDAKFKVERSFLQTNADYYGADVFSSPFNEQTVKDINNWVYNNTDGMIDKVIDEINNENLAYLINALVFDAEWQNKYEKDQVRNGVFHSGRGEDKKVEMMESVVSKYVELENASGFIRDYKDLKYSFVALLPNEEISVEEFIDSLNAQALHEAIENCQPYSVSTSIPKFEYNYEIKLKDVLKQMGMIDSFDLYDADFSKFGSYDGGNIYVGEVIHKTKITVAEKGTKAGAVTVVEMEGCTSAGPNYEKIVRLDRPFVYLIVDNDAKLPLFIGSVNEI